MVFLFGKYFRTPSGNRVFRVFSNQTAKQTFLNDFLLDFWANISEVFKARFFLMITWSKETSFGFEKLGEDCKSIFSNFTLQVTNPLFLVND